MEEEILKWVTEKGAAGQPAHILVSEQEVAERIARALAHQTGPMNTTLVSLETAVLPTTSVVVGTAAVMCFAYLRAKVRGETERKAAEDIIRGASALVVGVSAEERVNPCKIVDCSRAERGEERAALASLTLPEFFGMYALLQEIEVDPGTTGPPKCRL